MKKHPDPWGLKRTRSGGPCGRIAFLLLLAATVSLSGCSRQTNRLVFAINDPLCAETRSACVGPDANRDYAPLIAAMSGKLAARPRAHYAEQEDALFEMVGSGRANVLIAKRWTIARIARATGKTFIPLADLADAEGRTGLRGAFVVRADSDIRTLADLDGKVVGMGTVKGGVEKSIKAQEALSAAGAKPSRIVRKDLCMDVLAAVWEEKVDAGVVSEYVADHGGLDKAASAKDFRIIARTAPIPFITVAASADVPQSQRDALRRFLFSLNDKKVLTALNSTGFVKPMDWTPPEEKNGE